MFLSRPCSQTRIKPFNLGLPNNKGWRHLKKQTKWMHVGWIWSFLKTLIWSSFPELMWENVPHWRMMLMECIMCLSSSPHTTSTPWPACGWNQSLTTPADCEFVSENVIYSHQHQFDYICPRKTHACHHKIICLIMSDIAWWHVLLLSSTSLYCHCTQNIRSDFIHRSDFIY